MTITIAGFGFIVSGALGGAPVFAADAFHGSARIARLFYTSLGTRARRDDLRGDDRAACRSAPARDARDPRVRRPALALPVASSAWIVMAALFVATLFTPLVNGPLIGVLTAHARRCGRR